MVRALVVTRRRLGVALAAGMLVRLLALPLAGSADVESWRLWSSTARQGVAALYAPDLAVPMTYPPLAALQFLAVGAGYGAVDPAFGPSRLFNTLVKVPIVAAEFWLLWWLVAARRNDALAEDLALDPALVLGGAALGYLDPEAAALGLAAVLAGERGHVTVAALFAVAAMWLKPQGLFVWPAAALASARGPGAPWKSFVAISALVTAAATALTAVTGAAPHYLEHVQQFMRDGMLSGYGANVWWLVTGAVLGPARALTPIMPSDLAALGWPGAPLAASGALAALAGWGLWRCLGATSDARAALAATWVIHAWTVVSLDVHENHLVLALPFFWLAASRAPSMRPIAAGTALLVMANMALIYGVGEDLHDATAAWRAVAAGTALGVVALALRAVWMLPRPVRWGVAALAAWTVWRLAQHPPASLEDLRLAPGIDATLIVAALNVGLLAWHGATLHRLTGTRSAVPAPR